MNKSPLRRDFPGPPAELCVWSETTRRAMPMQQTKTPRYCDQWNLVRKYTHVKNMQMGIAHLERMRAVSFGQRSTYVSRSMAESKLVFWYALTTRKLPSTSAAASIMSTDS